MAVKTFKFFWQTHKWTGIVLALIFIMIAVTGFVLLIKKRVDWIQPPTQQGTPAEVRSFLPLDEIFERVLAVGHPAFRTVDDIDRVDVRPDRSLHKVRSRHEYAEIQIDAVTGEILSIDVRRSDLIESIHDGSIFGDTVHVWIMPAVTIAMLFLVFSGIWLWIEPIMRRRRWRARQRARRATTPAP